MKRRIKIKTYRVKKINEGCYIVYVGVYGEFERLCKNKNGMARKFATEEEACRFGEKTLKTY